jgi:heme-degrading monooxygenase HmoA
MVIGEALDDLHAQELVNLAKTDTDVAQSPGFQGMQILQEDGGKMVLIITNWTSREDCLRYHASRGYRKFLAQAQHALIGDFVVKVFRTE